jgi:hypothetical protein
MDLHQRQQFDFLLQSATERFVARMEERYRGADGALARLRDDPEAARTSLGDFVAALFLDFLLDNIDGACFVLRSLPRRSIEPHRAALWQAGTTEEALVALARALFAELLMARAFEVLEQHVGYQSV